MGKITYIHNLGSDFRDNPNMEYCTIDDTLNRRIKTSNEINMGLRLNAVFKIGNFVLKKQGEHLIYVIEVNGSDTVQYTFNLLDDLGYPISKSNN